MGISVEAVRSANHADKLERPEIGVPRPQAPPHPQQRPLDGRVSQQLHPQIAWRIKELDGFKIENYFDNLRLLDHLDFFRRNNIPHKHMRNIHKFVNIFTRDKIKTLNNILYDKGLSASEQLFAASVYKRLTGENLYLSTFYDELISGSNETTPEIDPKDFYPVPLLPFGDVNQKLRDAIFTNNFALVREAIVQGANLNIQDQELGWTPLHYAVANGNVAITYLLLQNGADPNMCPARGTDLDKWIPGKRKVRDPLHKAANVPLMKNWDGRDTEASKKLSPFALAFKKEHYNILLQLASAGAKFTQEQVDSIKDEETKRKLQNHFDLNFSTTLKTQKFALATEITSTAKKIVNEMNADSLERQSSVNKDIRSVISSARKDPHVIDQFRRDIERNPGVITYKGGKLLDLGLFEGKYRIDHDFLARKVGNNQKALHVLEANLHQGRLADAIGKVKVYAQVLGTRNMINKNGDHLYYGLNPLFSMDVIEGEDASSFTLVARAKFHHCLTGGHGKLVENYQHLFTIEQTYTIKGGVAVDFSAQLI